MQRKKRGKDAWKGGCHKRPRFDEANGLVRGADIGFDIGLHQQPFSPEDKLDANSAADAVSNLYQKVTQSDSERPTALNPLLRDP